MKKILIIPLIFAAFFVNAQVFDENQTQIDNDIVTNGVRGITGAMMNTAFSNLNQTRGLRYYDDTDPTYVEDSSITLYQGQLYLCNTSITVGEAWNAVKWDKATHFTNDGLYITADTNIRFALDDGIYFGTTKWIHTANDDSSVFFGHSAGDAITTGTRNTVIGYQSLLLSSSGTNHTCLGFKAGRALLSVTNNTLIGHLSGYQLSGNQNTFLGSYSGYSQLSGNSNVYLGHQAGYSNTTGGGNVFIGTSAGYSETGSQKLYIENSTSTSPLIYGDFDNDTLKFGVDGCWITGTSYFGAKPSLITTAGINMTNNKGIWAYNAAGSDGYKILNFNGSDEVELWDNVVLDDNSIKLKDSTLIIVDGDTLHISHRDNKFIIESSDTIQLGANSLKVSTNGNVYVTNEFSAAMLRQDDTWHAYGGFQDSIVVITLVESEWKQITNATNDLYTATESDGFTLSGDTLEILNTADYVGSMSITFTGTAGNVYQFRIYDITSAAQVGFTTASTGDGGADYVTTPLDIYFEATAGYKYILEVRNIDGSNSATIRNSTFTIFYLHD